MKTTRVIAWVLCAAPLAVASDRQRPQFGRQGFNRTADARDSRGWQPVSEQEWEKVRPWAEQNCKNRLNFIDRMGDSAQQERAKRLIVNRYHQIQLIPFASVRQVVEKQVQVQDRIFGAQIALRFARRTNDQAEEEKAKADLKSAVQELYNVQIEDKKVRIKRLTAELDRLTNHPELAEQWYKNMLRQVDGGVPADAPGRRSTQNASPDDSQRSPDGQ